MKSLLGLFYNKLKGSQEDIASESLAYILQESIESRKVINQIIKADTSLDFPDLIYKTQTTGKNLERPDISGKSEKGEEKLIIEAKFWASLTENQPNGYLKRLRENSVLIFLVPNLRKRAVFEEVLNRVHSKNRENGSIQVTAENLKITLTKKRKVVLVKSWHEVLQSIKAKLEEKNEIRLLSDLNQIIGLCEMIDQNAFSPITDDDLSPKIPKNINSYYKIVDKVVDELKIRNTKITTKGLIKSPQRFGYHRYFATDLLGMNFSLKLDLWEKVVQTPFWLGISLNTKNGWENSENLGKVLDKVRIKHKISLIPYANGKGYFLSIYPPLHKTEDTVIKEISTKINNIIQDIHCHQQELDRI